ncbi:MAG TPA: UPF0182 family protein [Pseudogracilibacillus sp.]|nr:UPF0182 family protein [Pseudogracilibacillus sp.]
MDSRKNVNDPKDFLKKVNKRVSFSVIIIALLIISAIVSYKILKEYVWMGSVGFESVYTTILYSKATLGIVGFLLFGILTFITLYWIRKSYISHFNKDQLPRILTSGKLIYGVMILAGVIIGLLGSTIVQGIGWEPALKFLNSTSFGKADPHFGKDVSFYIFILPFIQFVLYTLLNLAIFLLLIQAAAYSVFNIYRMSRSAQIHLGVTIGSIGLLLTGIHFFGRYDTLLTDQVNMFQKSVVHGLSYTDKLINVPKAYVLAAVAIIASVWIFISLMRGKIEAIIKPVGLYIGVAVIGLVASMLVQNFLVSPNEFSREEPFLQHNLDFTRAAYDLDSIVEKENPGNMSLDEDMVERNQLTLDNVRLNDSRPLLDIYNQLQTFRTYYKFNDMDIDRYEIDGEYEQVFIGARELSTDDLPDQAQTWVNKNLRYTHGYGVAMSHVNKVTKQGQPEYLMKNVPSEGELDVSRPQIYYGEEPYPNIITNTKVDEFDYPTTDANETNRYEEEAGIPLTGYKKWLFAMSEKSIRMIVSDQLTKESQLHDTRNIKDRVNRIAPFFDYDTDPYIVVRDDGSLVWMIDAYLKAERYPYSEAHQGTENYLRNSVKVTVDAYTGEVTFYVADEEDPLLQTYQKMLPQLFATEVPEDIKSHFRYPEVMFKTQAKMYGTYHMSNLEVFYNREDFWDFPTEKYFNEDQEMEPYYVTMKMEEAEEEEFVLMTPYTPKKRQNMISWMGVRNDGDNYGEMFVYKYPKQKNVYGPQQIENRINQDSTISKELNLWAQGGSEVIRGNLLVIPIEDTVLYVEPIYIESSNESSLPEVKQVVMAYGEHIVMEENFDKSLAKIMELIDPDNESSEGGKEKPAEEQQDQEEADEPEENESVESLVESEETLAKISKLFEEHRQATADGDWALAGQKMEEIDKILETLK